ncbi:MAG: L,D-transpeptidase family protein [Alphaproteobacteria bacterium]
MPTMTKAGWAIGRWLAVTAVMGIVGGHNARAALQLPADLKADRILVLKAKHILLILNGDTVLDTFRIALGRNPMGPKNRVGDGRTPEGHYVLDWRNAKSRFYRSIHISYPAPNDIEQARRLSVSPGGSVMIHGLPRGAEEIGTDQANWDWTDGCIAVSNSEMDEIWRRVDNGTPIDILP